jgi:hypothetical protein
MFLGYIVLQLFCIYNLCYMWCRFAHEMFFVIIIIIIIIIIIVVVVTWNSEATEYELMKMKN